MSKLYSFTREYWWHSYNVQDRLGALKESLMTLLMVPYFGSQSLLVLRKGKW